MKSNPHFTALVLAFFFAVVLVLPATAQVPRLGWEYSSSSVNFGDVTDIRSVENDTYLCTVARTHRTSDNNHFILIRVRQKSTGIHWFRSVDLGRFISTDATYFDATLAHDEQTVIMATAYEDAQQRESVMSMTFRFSTLSILFQKRYAWISNTFDELMGVRIEKRYTSSGAKNGFTILALGRNNTFGTTRLAALELQADLDLVSSVSVNAPLAYLSGSDSNDQFTITTGKRDTGGSILVFRYNSSTNQFDFAWSYQASSGNQLVNPDIAYNINTSTTNRNGYFVAATEVLSDNTTFPVVFRARNSGSLLWDKRLAYTTRSKGVLGANNRC